MYACIYGDQFQQSMGQPGMVANPARGQLNRETLFFSLSSSAHENSVSREIRPSRPASACSFSTIRLKLVCIVTHVARVWIDRVMLLILLVVI